MSVLYRMLPLLAATLACSAHAAGERMDLLLDRPIRNLEDLEAEAPDGFWDRFQLAFDYRVDNVFASRLHPFKVMGWNVKHPEQSWNQFLERGNHAAKSALGKTLEYSLRDAAVGLPIVTWLETQEETLGDLLVDSVDAVEEEAVAPTDPWYVPAERNWWSSLTHRRVLRYGIRPFRTDPYAFLSVRIKEGSRLLALGHARYYLRNFADHRFELAVSLPMARGFALDVGTAYQFGRHEDEKRLVVKLFKPLKHGGMVHLGLELQERPTLFAGVSLPL